MFNAKLLHRELHTVGGRQRISLSTVAQDIDQKADHTLAEYMEWITETYILKQATAVALDKLPDYRFFIVPDGSSYRLVKKRNIRSYLSYDSSRIESAYALLRDLHLTDQSKGIRLTRAGRTTLDELLAYHEERSI